jgi:hypothetical protein
MTDPFTKFYNIYVSDKKATCSTGSTGIEPISKIYEDETSPNRNSSDLYTVLKKKTLFEVSTYINNLLEAFTEDYNILSICHGYTKANKLIDDDNKRITDSTPIRAVLTLPKVCTDMFDMTTYKYNTSSSPDKKLLCQQFEDLNSLITDFKAILDSCRGCSSGNHQKEYEELIRSYDNMIKLRNELNTKMNELYSVRGYRLDNSKLYLDSTVYTSVLWTILATTFIFYIFKKM